MRALALAGLLLVGACSSEPDFDERFEAAQDKVQATAEEIDRQIEEKARAAGAIEPEADRQKTAEQ